MKRASGGRDSALIRWLGFKQVDFSFSVSILCQPKNNELLWRCRAKLYKILLLERRQRLELYLGTNLMLAK